MSPSLKRFTVVIPVASSQRIQKDMIGQTRDEVKNNYSAHRQVILDQDVAVGRIQLFQGSITKLSH